MKRVLQIGFSPNYGGVETFLMNYYRHINREVFQFDFINPYAHIAFEDEIVSLGGRIIKIVDFHHKPFSYFIELKAICKKYDIVHIHMLSAANLLPVIAAKCAGVKRIIVHSHNTETEDVFRRYLHFINRKLLYKLTDTRIACSKAAGKWLYGEEDFCVLNNAVDIGKYRFNDLIRREIRSAWGVNQNTKVVGHVGRLNMQKNHKYLIDVFHHFHIIDNNSKLILVGVGELEEEIRSQVKSYQLQDDVLFLGKRLDVDRIYNGFDYFVLPSLFEGLPVVLVEAETNGLKCLVSTGVPQESKISSSVYFFSLNDNPEIWAKKMIELGADRNENAVEEIMESGFDIETASYSLERLYM